MVSPESDVAANAGAGKYRWVVVGLLFAAMVINYIDRQMIGVLKPGYLQPEFGWTERDYANIVTWFQAAYALSYLFFGRFVDRIGAKLGLAVAFTLWTLAHIAHAAARSITLHFDDGQTHKAVLGGVELGFGTQFWVATNIHASTPVRADAFGADGRPLASVQLTSPRP